MSWWLQQTKTRGETDIRRSKEGSFTVTGGEAKDMAANAAGCVDMWQEVLVDASVSLTEEVKRAAEHEDAGLQV